MPGTIQPYRSDPSPAEQDCAARLRRTVTDLSAQIGGRSVEIPGSLDRTVEYLDGRLRETSYPPAHDRYSYADLTFTNVVAELRGISDPERIIVIGAHYDTAGGYPGANDNGSGVAAVLELAAEFAKTPQKNTIRWVLFANEEPPWFQGPGMGSYAYAKACRERREDVRAMLSLETATTQPNPVRRSTRLGSTPAIRIPATFSALFLT